MNVLSEPRVRRWWDTISPLAMVVWLLLVLAVMWAAIVAIAWAVWNLL